jgi:hypothetical protein
MIPGVEASKHKLDDREAKMRSEQAVIKAARSAIVNHAYILFPLGNVEVWRETFDRTRLNVFAQTNRPQLFLNQKSILLGSGSPLRFRVLGEIV